jgi:hypothetical protein
LHFSPSGAEYHVKKLIDAGLTEDVGSGYIVDKNVLGSMVRIGRRLIPYQVACAAFATAFFTPAASFRKGDWWLNKVSRAGHCRKPDSHEPVRRNTFKSPSGILS